MSMPPQTQELPFGRIWWFICMSHWHAYANLSPIVNLCYPWRSFFSSVLRDVVMERYPQDPPLIRISSLDAQVRLPRIALLLLFLFFRWNVFSRPTKAGVLRGSRNRRTCKWGCQALEAKRMRNQDCEAKLCLVQMCGFGCKRVSSSLISSHWKLSPSKTSSSMRFAFNSCVRINLSESSQPALVFAGI